MQAGQSKQEEKEVLILITSSIYFTYYFKRGNQQNGSNQKVAVGENKYIQRRYFTTDS